MGKVILKNINKKYDNKIVLDNIDFHIEEGSFFTFLGPSGCGKTTLLRIIAGFVKSESGSIYLGNEDITNIPAEYRKVGMVFQNYALFPHMNVYDNVAYGVKIKGLGKKEVKERVNKYLNLVNLNGYDKKLVGELSGGEQQRVALARTLAVEPKVLLLDEPLSNLDANLRDKMRIEIKNLQQRLGITTIFVTHDQKEALTMSDKIAVFNNGKCVQIGNPEEIYRNPCNSFVVQFVGDINIFKAIINEDYAKVNDKLSLDLIGNKSGEFISIRPEDIKLSKENIFEGSNVFKGIVLKVQFSGNLTEYIVSVNGEEFMISRISNYFNNINIKLQDEVFIEIPAEVIRVLAT